MRRRIYLITISILLMVLFSGGVHPAASCGNGICESGENCGNCEADCPCQILFDTGNDAALSTPWYYHSEIRFTPYYDMVITAIYPDLDACETECIFNGTIYDDQGTKLGETYETYPPFTLHDTKRPQNGTLSNEVTLIANTTYRIYQYAGDTDGNMGSYAVDRESPLIRRYGWYELTYAEIINPRLENRAQWGPLSFRLKGYLVLKCGDGACDSTETCDTCPADCTSCVCGDGACDSTETCDTCPTDCGSCIGCGEGTLLTLFDYGKDADKYDAGDWDFWWYRTDINFTPLYDMIVTAVVQDAYACGVVDLNVTIYDDKGNKLGETDERHLGSKVEPKKLSGTLNRGVRLTADRTYRIFQFALSTGYDASSGGDEEICIPAGGKRLSMGDYGRSERNFGYNPLEWRDYCCGDSAWHYDEPRDNSNPNFISFLLKGCLLLKCGDGACDSTETCAMCPADCGSCVCGDGACDSTETCDTCPADCGSCLCGDGTCEGTETCKTCPDDCGCPVGKVCIDSKCIISCEEEVLGSQYCSGDVVVRDYQTSDCKNETRELAVCSHGCSNGTCIAQCVSDSDCSLDQSCQTQRCLPVTCECGYPQNHQCYNYECCSDNDCGNQMRCSQYLHECVTEVGCSPIMINGPANDKLDILFIGAEFFDPAELEEKIIQLTNIDGEGPHRGFFDVEPFKSNKDKFNLWMSLAPYYTTYGTFSDCGTLCNRVVPLTMDSEYKSRCPYADFTITLFKESKFRSCAGGGQWDSLSCWKDTTQGWLVLHESGHSIGRLADEYLEPAFGSAPHRPNCADTRQEAEEWWGDLVGVEYVGYFEGCSYTLDNYRPTKNSIMRSSSDSYGPVNERAIRKVLEDFK